MQLGLKDALKVTSLKGIGTLVAGVEDFKAVVDSIGVCYMTSLWRDPRALDARDYADLLSAATGVDFRWHDLMSIGRRVSELERAFNTLHADFGRPDDYPPQRLFNTPISGGPYAGKVLAQETWDLMLDEYYSARGWDRVSGKPPDSCLRIMDERRRRNATCG
jgi:aldehyde:ferredoxin oxidoreductase